MSIQNMIILASDSSSLRSSPFGAYNTMYAVRTFGAR